jgi:hypothetical protein
MGSLLIQIVVVQFPLLHKVVTFVSCCAYERSFETGHTNNVKIAISEYNPRLIPWFPPIKLDTS